MTLHINEKFVTEWGLKFSFFAWCHLRTASEKIGIIKRLEWCPFLNSRIILWCIGLWIKMIIEFSLIKNQEIAFWKLRGAIFFNSVIWFFMDILIYYCSQQPRSQGYGVTKIMTDKNLRRKFMVLYVYIDVLRCLWYNFTCITHAWSLCGHHLTITSWTSLRYHGWPTGSI